MENNQPQQSPNLNNYQSINNSTNKKNQKDKSQIDLTVLLLGIFSFIIPIFGWFLSLAGIITYFFSNKNTGKAITGLILSILSRVIIIILLIISVMFLIDQSNKNPFEVYEYPYIEENALSKSWKSDLDSLNFNNDLSEISLKIKYEGNENLVGRNNFFSNPFKLTVANNKRDVMFSEPNKSIECNSTSIIFENIEYINQFENLSISNGDELNLKYNCNEFYKNSNLNNNNSLNGEISIYNFISKQKTETEIKTGITIPTEPSFINFGFKYK